MTDKHQELIDYLKSLLDSEDVTFYSSAIELSPHRSFDGEEIEAKLRQLLDHPKTDGEPLHVEVVFEKHPFISLLEQHGFQPADTGGGSKGYYKKGGGNECWVSDYEERNLFPWTYKFVAGNIRPTPKQTILSRGASLNFGPEGVGPAPVSLQFSNLQELLNHLDFIHTRDFFLVDGEWQLRKYRKEFDITNPISSSDESMFPRLLPELLEGEILTHAPIGGKPRIITK